MRSIKRSSCLQAPCIIPPPRLQFPQSLLYHHISPLIEVKREIHSGEQAGKALLLPLAQPPSRNEASNALVERVLRQRASSPRDRVSSRTTSSPRQSALVYGVRGGEKWRSNVSGIFVREAGPSRKLQYVRYILKDQVENMVYLLMNKEQKIVLI